MAILLDEATAILTDSVLHVGDGTYQNDKKHRAIIAACAEFLRVTRASTTTTDISVNSGVSNIDVTSSVTGFTVDDFVAAEISFKEVALASYETVRRRFDGSTPTGQPTMIGFRSDDYALFDKQTDQSYTLKLTHVQGLTSFTPGTASNPSLNIPTDWAHSVIWWGARAHMLMGEEGNREEAEKAMAKFQEVLQEAKASFPDTRWGVLDPNTHPIRTGSDQ